MPPAAARANPGMIGYGTTGIGPDDHLAMLALERASGTKFLHIPFAGSSLVKQNVFSRTIPLAVMNVAEGLNDMRQGTLRPLAQMGETRWDRAPTIPTLRLRSKRRRIIPNFRSLPISNSCRCASWSPMPIGRSCWRCGRAIRHCGVSIPGGRDAGGVIRLGLSRQGIHLSQNAATSSCWKS